MRMIDDGARGGHGRDGLRVSGRDTMTRSLFRSIGS